MESNMRNLEIKLAILILFATIAAGNSNLFAQVKIKQSVFSNGAAVVSNGKHRLAGTLGQAVAGKAKNSTFSSLVGFWYQHIDLFTKVKDTEAGIPKKFQLYQNFPNPFNPTTTIQFALPKKAKVLMTLYDILGREVTTLVSEEREAGIHQVVFDATELSSGIYFYRIQADQFHQTKKLIVVK
jgi:hypothetical protein